MKDAARPEELAERQRMAREQQQPKVVNASEGTADPSKTTRPTVMSRSEILCFEGIATLVPKRAIINKPKAMEDRLVLSENARLTSWTEFHEANRGWIKTIEVTWKQAQGKEPFSEETVKMLEGTSAVVVATFRGAPVSVLPLKAVESAPSASTTPSKP